jgi:hypothetical protein
MVVEVTLVIEVSIVGVSLNFNLGTPKAICGANAMIPANWVSLLKNARRFIELNLIRMEAVAANKKAVGSP